jgi:hypothetical protein
MENRSAKSISPSTPHVPGIIEVSFRSCPAPGLMGALGRNCISLTRNEIQGKTSATDTAMLCSAAAMGPLRSRCIDQAK